MQPSVACLLACAATACLPKQDTVNRADREAKRNLISAEEEPLQLAHPSATSRLPDNVFRAETTGKTNVARTWFSITEISSERVCMDYGALFSGEASRNDKNVWLDRVIDRVKTQQIAFHDQQGYKRPTSIVDELPNKVLSRGRGKVTRHKTVNTGRTASVCTEELKNRHGSTVGCAVYEDQAVTEGVNVSVDGEVVTMYGGVRICARNDNIVPPDATQLYVSLTPTTTLFISLTGDTRTTGKWGATGGRSALRSPVAETPAATTRRAPAPGETELETHRGGKIKVVPFKVVDRKGATVVELAVDGKLHIGDKVVGWVLTDGVARDAAGHATAILDRAGWVWVNVAGKVSKRALVRGNTAEVGLSLLSYRNGRFVVTGKKRQELPNRIVPASIAPDLALMFALSTGLAYLE